MATRFPSQRPPANVHQKTAPEGQGGRPRYWAHAMRLFGLQKAPAGLATCSMKAVSGPLPLSRNGPARQCEGGATLASSRAPLRRTGTKAAPDASRVGGCMSKRISPLPVTRPGEQGQLCYGSIGLIGLRICGVPVLTKVSSAPGLNPSADRTDSIASLRPSEPSRC